MRRPELLLSELDARFATLVQSLPAGLDHLALQSNTFLDDAAGMAFHRPSTLSPGPVTVSWLFWEQFEKLPDDLFLSLAEGGMWCFLASALLDRLLDGQAPQPALSTLLQQKLASQARVCLRRALGGDSSFWPEYEALADRHTAGLAAELAAQAVPSLFTFENYREIGSAKGAPVVTAIVALATASQQPETVTPIASAIYRMAFVKQIVDDVQDWPEDLAARRLTYPLRQAAPERTWRDDDWPAEEEVADQLRLNWSDIHLLDTAQQELAQAATDVAEMDCPGWLAFVEKTRGEVDQLQRRLSLNYAFGDLELPVNKRAD